MTSLLRALVVEPDGSHDHTVLIGFPAIVLPGLVGGPPAAITLTNHLVVYHVDDGPAGRNAPPNVPASLLARIFGWPSDEFLHGTAVFFGRYCDDGTLADVPLGVVVTFEGLHQLVTTLTAEYNAKATR